MTAFVVAVTGASGGLGASHLVCALAHRAGMGGRTVVAVDLCPGGGLDVSAGLEHLPGYRWPDLAEVEGDVDGARLVRRLPTGSGFAVLAGRGAAPSPVHLAPILTAVGREADVVVLDLPPAARLDAQGVPPDVVVLLAGLGPRQLADAGALGPSLRDLGPAPHLVTRGARAVDEVSEAVAEHLGLPLVAHLPDDPRAALDEERGRCPGARRRGAVARAAEAVLEACPGPPPSAVRIP